jgi:hypothetical protein
MPELFKPSANEKTIAAITALRHKARGHLARYNALIEQIWAVDNQLLATQDPGKKQQLEQEKQRIHQQIDQEGDEREYDKTIERIRALEIECYGKAKTGGSSPSGRL